jgi:ribosomal protein S18 acetylase RimI-like enzyme
MLSYLRLNQSNAEHFSIFCQVFRLAPTYIYASEGRVPTQDELRAMYNTSAPGVSTENIFIYGLFLNETLSGCSFVVRGYPKADTAYLVLLLLGEETQNQGIGASVLRKIAEDSRTWGCSKIAAVVDSANDHALHFWKREGFQVTFTKELKGMVGSAVGIESE